MVVRGKGFFKGWSPGWSPQCNYNIGKGLSKGWMVISMLGCDVELRRLRFAVLLGNKGKGFLKGWNSTTILGSILNDGCKKGNVFACVGYQRKGHDKGGSPMMRVRFKPWKSFKKVISSLEKF